jgi:hypothetical protein
MIRKFSKELKSSIFSFTGQPCNLNNCIIGLKSSNFGFEYFDKINNKQLINGNRKHLSKYPFKYFKDIK